MIQIGQIVCHKDIYNGKEKMEVVGIRRTEVELRGDYSGGTHPVCQTEWMPIEGVIIMRQNCPQKVNGSCPLHNIYCQHPDCEQLLFVTAPTGKEESMSDKVIPVSEQRKINLRNEIRWLHDKLKTVSKTKHRNDLLRQIKEREYEIELGQTKNKTPMTQEQYWKERCEAAENYLKVKGNSIDETQSKYNARISWETYIEHTPPAPVEGEGLKEYAIRAAKEYADGYIPEVRPQRERGFEDGFLAGYRWRGEQPPTCGARWVSASELPRVTDDNYVLRLDKETLRIGYFFYDENKEKKCRVLTNGAAPEWDIPESKFDGVEYLDESPCTCQQELDELRAWKKEALAVMPDFQAIGKELDIPIGQTVHDKILPWIADMKAWKKVVESNYPEMQAIQEELGVKAGKDILPAIHNLKSGQQVVLPTREEAEKWANGCKAKGGLRGAAMYMYDWLAGRIGI